MSQNHQSSRKLNERAAPSGKSCKFPKRIPFSLASLTLTSLLPAVFFLSLGNLCVVNPADAQTGPTEPAPVASAKASKQDAAPLATPDLRHGFPPSSPTLSNSPSVQLRLLEQQPENKQSPQTPLRPQNAPASPKPSGTTDGVRHAIERGSSDAADDQKNQKHPAQSEHNVLKNDGDPLTKTDQPPAPFIEEDVRPSSFKGITPGVSTAESVNKSLGEPFHTAESEDKTTCFYREGPFPKVEIQISQDIVQSITIHLQAPVDAKRIAQQLSLNAFEPVPVFSKKGATVAVVYPDRGVTLQFVSEANVTNASSFNVHQVVLEPITAEPFVWRVESDRSYRIQRSLNDLDLAEKLQPKNARVWWLRSQLLASLGRHKAALAAVDQAVALEPGNAEYRIAKGQLLFETGDYDQALFETQAVLKEKDLAPLVRALCQLQAGDLVFYGPTCDVQQAIEHHLAAIEKATTLTTDNHPLTRWKAKEIMLRAHLAAACDVAWGNWKDRIETTSKWLHRANKIAEHLVEREKFDASLKMFVYRRSLFAFTGLAGALDPTPLASAAIADGRKFITSAKDGLRKQTLEWELGRALFYALRVERARGNFDDALRYGDNALALLEAASQGRDNTVHQNYLLGRLYYYIGAVYAERPEGHHDAVTWYEKANALLTNELPVEVSADKITHGNRFVRMGVSYWRQGQSKKAITITEHGTRFIQEAVNNGISPPTSLAVPYANLAKMHKKLGNTDEAKKFAETAAMLEKAAVEKR